MGLALLLKVSKRANGPGEWAFALGLGLSPLVALGIKTGQALPSIQTFSDEGTLYLCIAAFVFCGLTLVRQKELKQLSRSHERLVWGTGILPFGLILLMLGLGGPWTGMGFITLPLAAVFVALGNMGKASPQTQEGVGNG